MTINFNEQHLERALLLDDAVRVCEKSPFFDAKVVESKANGQTYRCLLGMYNHLNGKNISMFETSEHFGLTEDEHDMLFGCAPVLSHRKMMVKAHIKHIELVLREGRKSAPSVAC